MIAALRPGVWDISFDTAPDGFRTAGRGHRVRFAECGCRLRFLLCKTSGFFSAKLKIGGVLRVGGVVRLYGGGFAGLAPASKGILQQEGVPALPLRA